MISHLDHLMDSTPEVYKPATCCPKCYDVMTDLKQQITDLETQVDQYKSDFENAVKHNQSLSDAHTMEVYDLRVENDKLKNYIINQLLTN
jgi:regulator of replication initiation timing